MTATSDPVASLALSSALVLVVAKVGGDLALRLRQPSVLGELLGGILLGSLPLPFLADVRADPGIDMLARLGVLVLLFQVGLESTVKDVARVGLAAAAVAVVGTVATLLAGLGVTTLVLPASGIVLRVFLGASLTATSIGISARVLQDAGASRTREGHTILTASVIDDVLGLLVLGVVSGAVQRTTEQGGVSALGIAGLLAKTFGFLGLAVLAGVKLSPVIFRWTARLRSSGALVAVGLSFCFVLAWASSLIGLAPLVGAFTAGLILEDSHSARFVLRGERPLSEQMDPISSWLVPIFFVLMGMRADVRALFGGGSLLLVAGLLAAAVAGKLACAVVAPRGSRRLVVALGMIPRGEVSLVFASLGLSQGILDVSLYSALVAVVVLTTLATPAALRWQLARAPAS